MPEQESSSRKENTNLPTELQIPRLGGINIESLKQNEQEGKQFSRELEIAKRKINQFDDEISVKLDNLRNIESDQYDLALQYTSYRTVSAAYLKISEVLADRKLSPEEFNSFFKLCLSENCIFHDKYSGDGLNFEEGARKRFADENNLRMKREMEKRIKDPPAWFGKDRSAWFDFVDTFSSLDALLEPENHSRKKVTEMGVGYTNKDWMPDWFEDFEANGKIDKEVVEQELANDTQEQRSLINFASSARQKQNALQAILNSKFSRAIARFELKRRKLFSNVNSFPNLLIYLSATQNTREHSGIDFENEKEFDPNNTVDISALKAREKNIRLFSEEMPLTDDLIALWLERKFKEADLKPSIRLTNDILQPLGMFRNEDREEFKTLQLTNKKLFKILNYDINPLIRLASAEEQEYLSELIKEGGTVEDLIHEIAYLVGRNQFSVGSSEQKTIQEIRKFSKTWLTSNWEWAYSQLVNRLNGTIKKENDIPIQNDGLVQKEDEIETREVEEVIDSVHDLSNWNVYYTTNMRVQKGGEFIKIEGETLKDKQESLLGVLVEEGDQVSIKNSSVVNALDWITTIPDDILAKWPVKEVNGEPFKKVKRGAVRILFQIDKKSKQIVFFLHQKKAWHYKF